MQAINKKADCFFRSKHNEETASNLAADFLYQTLKKSESKNILLFTGSQDSSLHLSAKKNLLSLTEVEDDQLQKALKVLYGETLD